METIIGWLIPIFGLPASWYFFNEKAKKSGGGELFYSISCSLGLTVILIFIAMSANTGCIEIGVCKSHGDANMSYMFNAIFLIPAYIVIIAIKPDKPNT